MSPNRWLLAVALLGLLQPAGVFPQGKSDPAPLDENREILKLIRETYADQYDVPEDVLGDLRKSYAKPSASREASIFSDLRRLYIISPEREAAILLEIRKAYEQPTPEQEKRIFREIDKAPRVPQGAVALRRQQNQAAKLFQKFDLDGDERLHPDEMSDTLRRLRQRWDADGNGWIDPDEFWVFYQERLRDLSDQVLAGKIDLGLKNGGPLIVRKTAEAPALRVRLPEGLPLWFTQLDLDRDGQISLFEWRKGGKALKDFPALDRNDDGLATADEVLRLIALGGDAAFSNAARDYDERRAKKKN
jgi:hypothetical protein